MELNEDVRKEFESIASNTVNKALEGRDYSNQMKQADEPENRWNQSNKKGITFARFVKAAILTQREIHNGNSKAAQNARKFQEDLLRKGYAKDKQFINKLDKALEQDNDGGLLVPEIYSDEFIELLYNQTVVRQMGATVIPMEKGNININKMLDGLTAQYIPEGGSASFSNIKLGRIRLSSKKLMALSAVSNDLLRTNSYYADRILLNDMIEAMAQAMDYAALYGTGGEDAPLGIANTEGIQTETVDEVPTRSKLVEMKSRLGKKNINLSDSTVGWVMSWDSWKNLSDERDAGEGLINRELVENGTMLGHPVLVTNQVRTNESDNDTDIFFGKWNDLYIGEEFNVEVAADGSTSFTDEDGRVINAFTNDFTVYRAIMKHDMKLARGVSFVKYVFDTE